MSTRWLALCWALCSTLAVAAEEERIEQFAGRLPLSGTGSEGIYRMAVPLAVYRGVAFADLRDLRVINAAGERVPFALYGPPRSDTEQRSLTRLPMFPLYETPSAPNALGGVDLQIRQQADGTLLTLHSGGVAKPAAGRLKSYVLDASKLGLPMRALQFDWAAGPDTREGRVRIEASDDLKNWQHIADGTLIDLEFAGQRLQQQRVDFAPTRAKYLRLSWDRNAFPLNSVSAEAIESGRAPPTETMVIAATAGEKTGEYVFDTAARLPVERARLLLPDANTLAPTQLLVRTEGKAAWRSIGNGTFYRLNRDGKELVSPATAVTAYGERYWLARIDNRSGGLGGALPKLEISWNPGQIAFVARGKGPFSLAFGNDRAQRTALELPALIPGYRSGSEESLPVASVSTSADATTVLATTSTGFDIDQSQVKRLALWLLLVGGVALLAWMAMRLGRDLNAGERKDEQDRQ
ncbi:MAG: DUF3999 domain-containing protein [Betaproteobacteria bacterium]|nr:DUF3999 domain-containing protein [Betaproteobacteria bacterium]